MGLLFRSRLVLRFGSVRRRERTLQDLGRRRAAGAFDLILAGVYDRDENVRRAAVGALGDYQDPRALATLLGLLDDGRLRGHAVEALGRLGDRGAAEALIDRLGDYDLRFAAADALAELSRQHPTLGLAALAESKGQIDKLEATRDPRVARTLLRIARTAPLFLRFTMVSMPNRAPEVAVEALVRLLKSRAREVPDDVLSAAATLAGVFVGRAVPAGWKDDRGEWVESETHDRMAVDCTALNALAKAELARRRRSTP